MVDGGLLAVYRELRSYIEHEDKLIGERISRTLLTHGFLLASFVLLLQARVGAAAQCLARDKGCYSRGAAVAAGDLSLAAPDQLSVILLLADCVLPLIAVIGILTSLAARRGVMAAELAIGAISAKWSEISGGNAQLPWIIGGGSQDVLTKYTEINRRLLRYLSIMWAAICAISLVLGVVWNSPALTKWLLQFIARFLG